MPWLDMLDGLSVVGTFLGTLLAMRIERHELLDHETRARLYEAIQEDPGQHLRELKRSLALAHGTLLHHLRMLERGRLVSSFKDGMYRRFYVRGTAPQDARGASTRDRLAAAIRAEPGRSVSELAEALDRSPSTIHHHLEALTAKGRGRKIREGQRVAVYPASSHA